MRMRDCDSNHRFESWLSQSHNRIAFSNNDVMIRILKSHSMMKTRIRVSIMKHEFMIPWWKHEIMIPSWNRVFMIESQNHGFMIEAWFHDYIIKSWSRDSIIKPRFLLCNQIIMIFMPPGKIMICSGGSKDIDNLNSMSQITSSHEGLLNGIILLYQDGRYVCINSCAMPKSHSHIASCLQSRNTNSRNSISQSRNSTIMKVLLWKWNPHDQHRCLNNSFILSISMASGKIPKSRFATWFHKITICDAIA